MALTLTINEDRTVEHTKENLVQGDCCATEFIFNFPATILGVEHANYSKTIEFGECKEHGECEKFVDSITNDMYDLKEFCTCYKKIMVQIVLTRLEGGKKIVWKTIPFALEFHESVNAEGTPAVQANLLSLANIEAEWAAFINANCVQVIKASSNIPSPENCNCGVMFYLGITANGYTYGHYYKAVERDGVWIWEDINPETTVTDVANGIRELNKNRVIQFFKGTLAEYNADENLHDNIIFIPESTSVLQEIEDEFNKIEEMLDNLGFIEGSATVSLDMVDITQNYIKRQGNYCILDLVITNYKIGRELSGIIATLPINFRPKETFTTYVACENEITSSTYNALGVAECTISTDGTITVNSYLMINGYEPIPTEIQKVYLQNIGYEATPIE